MKYEEPKMIIVKLDADDIIVTSNWQEQGEMNEHTL